MTLKGRGGTQNRKKAGINIYFKTIGLLKSLKFRDSLQSCYITQIITKITYISFL